MYPNILFVSAVNLFFKIYSIISVENKYFFFSRNSLCEP